MNRIYLTVTNPLNETKGSIFTRKNNICMEFTATADTKEVKRVYNEGVYSLCMSLISELSGGRWSK